MGVEKFSISLPEELLASLDDIAAEEGLTRSALIREVTSEYVARRTSAAYEEDRRRRIDSAIEGFKRVAEMWGPDHRTAAELVREIRDEEIADGG